jgi:hypothetical protein
VNAQHLVIEVTAGGPRAELGSTHPAATGPCVVVHHPDGTALADGARVEKVIDLPAHEGPVYAADEDALYVTTLPVRSTARGEPHVAVVRVALDGTRFPVASSSASTLRAPAGAANGMTLAPDAGLLVCEQGSFRSPAAIARIDRRTGERERLVISCEGAPLNSPNDVVVAADGAIWFTDPSYGFLQGFRPAPRRADAVCRHDPATATTTAMADDLDKPNGLTFSPDGSVLYVADSGANHEPGSYDASRPHEVVAYDVVTLRSDLPDRRRPEIRDDDRSPRQAVRLAGRHRLATIDPGSRTGSRSTPPGACTCRAVTASRSGIPPDRCSR